MTHTSTEQPEALRLAECLDFCKAQEGSAIYEAAAELHRLHACVQELEAQVQRAAEAERAAILLRVKNRAAAGALLVKDFQAIVNDRGPAQQAVQAAVPNPITVSAMRDDGGEQPAYCVMAAYRTETDARAAMSLLDGTAHPAEGVPAQASKWDGKLPERLQSVLNALRLELPAAVVNDVEFEVRSHYEAMHTSLSTSRRMNGAARDRLEAIDAAQPDPFAATQPAVQGIDGREFPPLTPELASILGLMCFQCISFAQALRAAGHTIKTRAEDEQAAVLHWMLGHYFRHGDDWRTAAAEDMKRMEAEALAAQPKQGGDHG